MPKAADPQRPAGELRAGLRCSTSPRTTRAEDRESYEDQVIPAAVVASKWSRRCMSSGRRCGTDGRCALNGPRDGFRHPRPRHRDGQDQEASPDLTIDGTVPITGGTGTSAPGRRNTCGMGSHQASAAGGQRSEAAGADELTDRAGQMGPSATSSATMSPT